MKIDQMISLKIMAVYSLSLNFETHNLSKATTIVGRFSLIVKIIISSGCENLQHTKLFNEDDFLNSTEIHNYKAGPLLEFVLVYKIKLQLAVEQVVNSNVRALFIKLSFPRIVDKCKPSYICVSSRTFFQAVPFISISFK